MRTTSHGENKRRRPRCRQPWNLSPNASCRRTSKETAMVHIQWFNDDLDLVSIFYFLSNFESVPRNRAQVHTILSAQQLCTLIVHYTSVSQMHTKMHNINTPPVYQRSATQLSSAPASDQVTIANYSGVWPRVFLSSARPPSPIASSMFLIHLPKIKNYFFKK
jgi:hypothetical protein